MFIGPWDQGGPWNYQGIEGVTRFLNRVWTLVTEGAEDAGGAVDERTRKDLRRAVHTAIKEVTEDLEGFRFNTAVAELMTLVNAMNKVKSGRMLETPEWQEGVKSLTLLLAPIAPHLAEELWRRAGFDDSVHTQSWPDYDPKALISDTITIAVQVNGKRRGEVEVPKDADKATILAAAKSESNVARYIENADIVREIVVPGRLVNLVVKG